VNQVQTQTRRLQKIALLASRHEAEFVSGVLEAADVPHAIVEAGHGLELRVDPDDSERVRELIERLDVRREVAESARQRRGESTGRRALRFVAFSLVGGLCVWLCLWWLGLPPVGVWVGACTIPPLALLGEVFGHRLRSGSRRARG